MEDAEGLEDAVTAATETATPVATQPHPLRLYSYPNNIRADKVLIVARYNAIEVEVPMFSFGTDNKTEEFLKKNPLGKVPVLDTHEGPIWESNAIARYVARLNPDTGLYGRTPYEASLVDQWIDFSVNEIDLPVAAWLYPIMGFIQNNEFATRKAKGDVRKSLHILNQHLESRTYLVGDSITLSDIVVCCSLMRAYSMVLDPSFRKGFPRTNRWFEDCVAQENFKAVLGNVQLCERMQVAPKTRQTTQE